MLTLPKNQQRLLTAYSLQVKLLIAYFLKLWTSISIVILAQVILLCIGHNS
jgi:hypothetical protein